jgi:lipopolysaccharide transport system permease protein
LKGQSFILRRLSQPTIALPELRVPPHRFIMFSRFVPFAADLWQHRELLWQFTLRNVELRHKGSHLGLIWSFLNPLLMLGLYILVFGYIFGGSFGIIPHETRVDYGLGIFFGLTLFHFVSEVLALSPGIIVGNPNFVKKVVFPLEILPAANVVGAVFHMLISLGLLLVGILALGPGLSVEALWLPVILLPVVLLMLGASWFFSALGVFFRDVGQVMQFVTMMLMFASAVFYSAAKIPPAVWTYMRFNPVLLAIELARDAALWARPLNFHHLAYVYAAGFAACYLGYAAFSKMKPAFADVL